MSILQAKIADMLGSYAASLQLSMLLPAALLVGGLTWLLAPWIVAPNIWFLIFVSSSAIVVSYFLHAFNMPIIRVLEGYILADTLPLKILRRHQLGKYGSHHARIDIYEDQARKIVILESMLQLHHALTEEKSVQLDRWKRTWKDLAAHEKERLEERFPDTADRVLATGLGNAIAAFEMYPQKRYCIDISQLWTRFVPALLETKYSSFIEAEKAILDFFVNTFVVSVAVWMISLGVFAATGRLDAGSLLLALPILAGLVYGGACIAAANWGNTIRSAFDLYRFELAKALRLQMTELRDLEQERYLWQGISEFLATGSTFNFAGFDYTRGAKEQEI